MDRKLTYKDEENELLYTLLDKRFFSIWKDTSKKLWSSASMELYITPDCNLSCEYCYLHKFGDKLYPQEYNNRENILSNLERLFEWMIQEHFYLNELQLFSGEIWHLPFGFEVLETILSYMQKGLKISYITLPTNTSFALNQGTLDKMQEMVNRFSKSGCRLIISHSIDGMALEDISRPMKDDSSIRGENFYTDVFEFAKRNEFYFHPMVAAANIEKWNENYDWYKEMCKKYEMKFPRSVMMLEVRNSDWTPEKIEYLKQYYKHQIDYLWEESNHEADKFLAKAFGIRNCDFSESDDDVGYSNIGFPLAKAQAGCSIPSTLSVRVGDLAIVPCHRTAYSQFIYGKFKVNEGKIIGIEAENTQVAMKILYSNNLVAHHGCDVCSYNGVCMRACYGEQYESTDEIFMPDPIVCNMFKAKFDFLIDVYDEMGILKHMSNITPSDTRYIITQEILKEIDRINEARGDVVCSTK